MLGRRAVLLVLLVVVVAGTLGCSPAPASAPSAPPGPSPSAPDPGLPGRLAAAVGVDGALSHLSAWQTIADRNGGTREAGTPGHEQSADDVADQLRRAGFRVELPSFTVEAFDPGTSVLTVDGRPVPDVLAMKYSPATPPTGVTAPLVVAPADPTPGCEAGDYAGLPVRGAVVLVRRGVCPFTVKQQVAADLGAAAVLVANTGPGPVQGALDAGRARLPTAGITQGAGDALAARPGTPVTLAMSTRTETRTTRNVIAQTVTGRPDEVVMAGAHLDSVAAGPGINDNGSGSAAQLETALRLGSAPPVRNAVRFAWWSAEELGLLGSQNYVSTLSADARRDIALVLNDDMVGSPNPAYWAYDGDDSDHEGTPAGPPGSAGVERTLVAALAAQGVSARGTDFDGRSDYGPFVAAGIAAGGLFTGAEGAKTPDEAALWGGRAGVPYDGCYHQACDRLTNVDRTALERMLRAFASTVATYALDLGGPNGVPTHDQRAPR